MHSGKGGSRSFLDPELLARLSRLRLESRFPMSGGMSGHHRSPHRGSSVEFAEYRKYAPGDDIRLLDWRVYARTDRFFMKEFEAETNLRAYFVLDCSGSMRFRGAGEEKLFYAKRMVAVLAALTVKAGDAAGLSFCGTENHRDVPARRNAAHLANIYESLDQAKGAGPTVLAEGLHRIAGKIPRRSMVLIFSDLLEEPGPLLSSLHHLRHQKHDVTVFHLLDPQEVEFPFDRPTRFVDLEGPSSILADPAMARSNYLRALELHCRTVRDGCREQSVEYQQVLTGSGCEEVLAQYLAAREQ
jgi:uncharacterized protein (DUF58 family)